jgi:uncharacterized protein YxjI
MTQIVSNAQVEQRFAGYQQLTVRQKKRWLEILTSWEVKNSYEVFDGQGSPVLRVREQGSGFLSLLKRLILGPMRPLHVLVTDILSGAPLLELRRPFRFIFHRIEVSVPGGAVLGVVHKRWSWFRRIYDIENERGQVLAELFGPILKPWTFEIRVNGQEVGAVRKRWSGFGKEMFTDADNFGVDLSGIHDAKLKLLAFAAVVLIDVVHFERAKN